jgi:hypothetical protein
MNIKLELEGLETGMDGTQGIQKCCVTAVIAFWSNANPQSSRMGHLGLCSVGKVRAK